MQRLCVDFKSAEVYNRLMNLSHTEQEMLETEKVCLNFDFSITADIAKKIGESRIIFTGMGSSLIFPGKHAKNRALKFNISNKVESYFASDLFQYEDFLDNPEENIVKILKFIGKSVDREKILKEIKEIRADRKFAFIKDQELVKLYNKVRNKNLIKKLGYGSIL